MHSPAKVSEILTANERSYSISRPGNPLYRYDTNSVASNDPCEDTQAFTILEHEGKDFILASVFDGHSGFHTSRLLAETLEKYIARELFEVLRGNYKSLRITNESWWNWLWHKSKEGPTMPAAQAAEPESSASIAVNERVVMIPEALRNAYKLADRDIVQSPVEYMRSLDPNSSATGRSSSSAPRATITEEQRLRGASLLNPALSGACSLSTLIDTSSSSPSVYVAVAGDSRAVMGTFDAASGKWIASVLSEDQTGKSHKEVHRMQAEHPKSEAETVILRGRVLGGLEPTRSLGDAKYKW
jgi:pyruvate dehydrogenase phosphatase